MNSNFSIENADINIDEILGNLGTKNIDQDFDKPILESEPPYKETSKNPLPSLKTFVREKLKLCLRIFATILIAFRNLFHREKIDKKEIRFVQLVTTYVKNDAIGNDITQMAAALDKLGYKNCIVTWNTTFLKNPKVNMTANYHPRKNDILLYHKCSGSKTMTKLIKKSDVYKKIMIYHNITPSKYFINDKRNKKMSEVGRKQLKELAPYFDATYSVSKYNQEELIALNYKNNGVLPVFLLDDALKNAKINNELLTKFSDGITNILFVGRISYNKAQDDIIKSFYIYHKYFNSNSRLILVGSDSNPHYSSYLDELINKCKLQNNVVFPKIENVDDLATIYKTASLFLIESEHEGFCVPLLEAMLFNVPILAYSSSAIPYTLDDAGVIFTEKDHYMISSTMDIILKNKKISQDIARKGEDRLKYFSYENTFNSFKNIVNDLVNKN